MYVQAILLIIIVTLTHLIQHSLHRLVGIHFPRTHSLLLFCLAIRHCWLRAIPSLHTLPHRPLHPRCPVHCQFPSRTDGPTCPDVGRSAGVCAEAPAAEVVGRGVCECDVVCWMGCGLERHTGRFGVSGNLWVYVLCRGLYCCTR